MYPHVHVQSYGLLPVPYQTSIVPSLSAGTQIHVRGTPTGSRFEVNLKNHHDDVVFHFNPRFDDYALILNSAQRGSWGQEERQSLPLQRGVPFSLVITATGHGFNVNLNNAHVCDYHQRVPSHLAQLVEVKGDINLESVNVVSGGMGGFPAMGGFPPMGGNMPYVQPPYAGGFNPGAGFTPAPSVFPSAPSFPMGGGGGVPTIQSCRIHTGSRIFVRGFIPQGANRFELNLLQGYTDTDDIAFHFNPRFDTRTIVKNHRRHGQWGSEENQPFPAYMPLAPGVQIDLQIACQPDKYVVLMGHSVIAEFYHKITPGSVQALQYKGDITITSVGQL